MGWDGEARLISFLLALCSLKSLRPFSTLDLMTPILGVAPEYTRQLLLEGPVRVKEGREGKVRVPCTDVTCKDTA